MEYDEKTKNDEEQNDEEHDTITLTFEDGTEEECLVLDYVEVDGKTYVSLLPMSYEEDEEEEGCYLYQFDESEEGEPILGYIEDDDVLKKVMDAFAELFMEEPEYMISEEDL